MDKDTLKKIKQAAQRNKINRADVRFKTALTFLVQKGMLFTNTHARETLKRKVNINDAIWAGLNVEPRILEVLPAAILRFPKYFDWTQMENENLNQVLNDLRNNVEAGHDFYFIPYDKIRKWAHHPLKDGRVKPLNKKKTAKNYRFTPETITKLKTLSLDANKSETDIIEELIRKA